MRGASGSESDGRLGFLETSGFRKGGGGGRREWVGRGGREREERDGVFIQHHLMLTDLGLNHFICVLFCLCSMILDTFSTTHPDSFITGMVYCQDSHHLD